MELFRDIDESMGKLSKAQVRFMDCHAERFRPLIALNAFVRLLEGDINNGQVARRYDY